jgi:protein gp37
VGDEAQWTGVVRFRPDMLKEPMRWVRPRRIFVNSMSDWMHESLSDSQIFLMLGAMMLAPQHTFQALTKRERRQMALLSRPDARSMTLEAAMEVWTGWAQGKVNYGQWSYERYLREQQAVTRAINDMPWPMPHLWVGASAEDQATYDARWPYLAATPAAIRWWSLEPLLGPIDIQPSMQPPVVCELCWREWNIDAAAARDWQELWWAGTGAAWACGECVARLNTLGAAFEAESGQWAAPGRSDIRRQHRRPFQWFVLGGESGMTDDCRPCVPDWLGSLVSQCSSLGVSVFVKQLGTVYARANGLRDRKAADWDEWGWSVRHLKRREFPDEDGRILEFPATETGVPL